VTDVLAAAAREELALDTDHVRRAADETRAALAPSEAVWTRWQRWLDDDATWPTHLALARSFRCGPA
jgi:hypothetical protein